MTDALTKRYELYISLENINKERMSTITTPVSLVKLTAYVRVKPAAFGRVKPAESVKYNYDSYPTPPLFVLKNVMVYITLSPLS